MVPITVPQMYTPITPRPSAPSRPKRSPINATFGSRAIEWAAPMDSRFRPTMTARGTPIRIVPRLPNSCKISAGDAAKIFGRLGPTRQPYLAINKTRVTPNRELAVFTSLSVEILVKRGAVSTPMIRAYIMGSSTIFPTPTAMVMLPIFSATITRISTVR